MTSHQQRQQPPSPPSVSSSSSSPSSPPTGFDWQPCSGGGEQKQEEEEEVQKSEVLIGSLGVWEAEPGGPAEEDPPPRPPPGPPEGPQVLLGVGGATLGWMWGAWAGDGGIFRRAAARPHVY